MLSAALIACSNDDNRPNIIIFFTDDQGYADLSCYGAEGFQTPNLDRLASEGIMFTDFYVPATVCTPSRAGLLTGRYPLRSGLHEAVIYPFSEHGLAASEYTLAEMLREGGYSTGIIGKWHLGHASEEYHPLNHGFEYFFGVPYSNDMDSYYYRHNDFQSPPLPVYRNMDLVEEGPDQCYLTQMYTREAISFIKREKDGPFFLYLPHSMPHAPLHVSENFKGKSEKGLYGDVIGELDWSAGELVRVLKEESLYENTIFIFTSDNGPQYGSAFPLRGKKASTWEGGQRVPGIIVWPQRIPGANVSKEFVSTMDLLPTLASIAGIEFENSLVFDGMDISDHLFNPEDSLLPDRAFYYFGRDGDIEAVRRGDWKLHISKRGIEDFEPALYNLSEDISESVNLADNNPDMVEELRSLIEAFNKSLN
jgi:arylsulfatase A-like enzyme